MEQLDDDTLIALIKKGDTHAETLLCAKYWVFAQKFGKQFASMYKDLGLTVDDFSTVAFSSIVVALKKYSKEKFHSFYNYWLAVAKNQCLNYVYDNCFISMDYDRPVSLDSLSKEDGLTLHEICGLPDDKITYGLTRKQLYDFIVSDESKLTINEKVIAYYMFLNGYNSEDIRLLTKWSKEKVYSIVKRTRKKVSNFFKSGYFK